MDNNDLSLANRAGIFKSVSEDALGSLLCDELNGLDDTRDNDVLDTRVLTLRVLTDEDSVDAVVGGLVTKDRLARTDVSEKIESSSKGQVEGNVTFTDRSSKRALESDEVLADRGDSGLGDCSLTIDKDGSYINWLPFNWDLSSLVNILDSLRNFNSNTVSLNKSDCVVALSSQKKST